MRSLRAVSARSRLAILVAILLLGCTDKAQTIDAVATDGVPIVQDLDNGAEAAPEIPDTTADPFRVFRVENDVDAIATLSLTPVWLINNTASELIVIAVGGAATVLVDTVGAADSVLVRIETRADSVALSARTQEGLSMGSITLRMDSQAKRAAFPQ